MMKGWMLKAVVSAAALTLALSVVGVMAGPGGNTEVSNDVGSTSEGGDGEDAGGEIGGGEAECFLTVLNDGTHSYLVLQEHVSDAGMPGGGVAGNLNALDKICFGTLETPKGNTTPVPGKSGDAPGRSEDFSGESESDPGKSEQAPGEPTADGQARGEGQEKADANGNGPADAPGQNEPE